MWISISFDVTTRRQRYVSTRYGDIAVDDITLTTTGDCSDESADLPPTTSQPQTHTTNSNKLTTAKQPADSKLKLMIDAQHTAGEPSTRIIAEEMKDTPKLQIKVERE